MPDAHRRWSTLLAELTKVTVIFVAFYLLQTQIFQVQHDLWGRASGLARAQERTTDQLDSTQAWVRDAVGESTRRLERACREIEARLQRLRHERDGLRRLVDRRAREVAKGLEQRIREEEGRLESLVSATESQAAQIRRLQSDGHQDARRMKQRMIFPTVQLRGNGTVGSGVLIYSREQPEVEAPAAHTSFLLTASHVVHEVTGERLAPGLRVEEVRVLAEEDEADLVAYPARVVAFDRGRDIALLRIESGKSFPWLAELAPREELEELDVFSPAYAVGCPLGNRPMPTLGEISSKRKVVGEQVFWMLNAPTFFGNSGGGVYRAPDCQLIGVSSMIYTYGKTHPTVVPHMGLFVPLDMVYRWLETEGLGFVARGLPVPSHLRERLVWRSDAGPGTGGAPAAPASRESGPGASPERAAAPSATSSGTERARRAGRDRSGDGSGRGRGPGDTPRP